MTLIDVPGARLHYETLGSGPLLVMIPGANGVGDGFRFIAEHLTDRYTVLIYDRRGFSRSGLHGPQDYDSRLETDACDVRRLIEHAGTEPATVFGTSSGAIVALQLITAHPSVVHTLVPFEPPAVRLLSDGKRWLDFFAEIYETYRRAGVDAALTRFRDRSFAEPDRRVMAHAPRKDADIRYWFEHELRQYPRVDLDLPALAAHADRLVLAVGRESRGYPCREVDEALARKLGVETVELPGGHVGHVAQPAAYARELALTIERAR